MIATKYRRCLIMALKTASEAARVYAQASIERHAAYESPTLFSDLAYREARTAAHVARYMGETQCAF